MSLKNYWYIAAESREVRDRPLSKIVYGERIVLFRKSDGSPVALEDRCAHRNVALSQGRIKGDTIECGYHGLCYDGQGLCRYIPSLGGASPSLPHIQIRSYPVMEQEGYIWIVPGPIQDQGKPFSFPYLGEQRWTSFRMQNLFQGPVESCLENFLDCPHTVYVHKDWFRTHHTKPVLAVVRRLSHSAEVEFKEEPISPSIVSRLLFPKGRHLKHTDQFLIPSISRVDYTFGPDRHFIITSQCTPVDAHHTQVYTVITYRFDPIAPGVRLLFEPLCRRIIRQDTDIIRAQSENIRQWGRANFTYLATDLLGPHIKSLREAYDKQNLDSLGLERLEKEVTLYF